MVSIYVDGKQYEVDENRNLIDSLKDVGIQVPYFCYHPELSIVGMCRICLVEVEGSSKLQPACNLKAQENLKIKVVSEKAIKAREGVMEFLLINHPLDCPVCDKSGECDLQDYSFTVGGPTTRYKETKRDVSQEEIGTNLLINHNRCILCYKCVRFDNEILGIPDLEFIERGRDTLIGYTPPTPDSGPLLDHNYQGALADICPVGALLNKNTLFSSRVWWYNQKQSICHGCSTLCNVTTNVRNNEIYRYMPPENPDKNGYFICDQGRFSATEFSKDRLFSYLLGPEKAVSNTVLPKVSEKIFMAKKILWLGGTIDSNEEIDSMIQIKKKIKSKDKQIKWEFRTQEYMWKEEWNDQIDLLLSKDQRPNSHAFLKREMGDILSLKELMDEIKNADIIFILNEFSSPYAYLSNNKSQLQNNMLFKIIEEGNLWNKVILLSTHENEATEKSFATIPIKAFVEKNASFTDKKGNIRKANQSIQPPQGLLDTAGVMSYLFENEKINEKASKKEDSDMEKSYTKKMVEV